MLFADDVVLVDNSRTEVNRKLKTNIGIERFRLSRTKTEYMQDVLY